MISLVCMYNEGSPENMFFLKTAKWEKVSNNTYITKKVSIDRFYEITNIHIPTVYALYDKVRAKTGYSNSNIHFDFYLAYIKTKSGYLLQAVVTKNDRKIIDMKTTATMWDYLELFQK